MSKTKIKGSAGVAFTIVLTVWLGLSAIIALWTERNLEWAVSLWKEQPTDIPFMLSWLLTFVLNGAIVTANIVAEIVRFIV